MLIEIIRKNNKLHRRWNIISNYKWNQSNIYFKYWNVPGNSPTCVAQSWRLAHTNLWRCATCRTGILRTTLCSLLVSAWSLDPAINTEKYLCSTKRMHLSKNYLQQQSQLFHSNYNELVTRLLLAKIQPFSHISFFLTLLLLSLPTLSFLLFNTIANLLFKL